MTRTPREIAEHHAGALLAGDIEEIVGDYTADAVVVTSAGVRHGKEGVRQALIALLTDLPDATWKMSTQIFEGDMMFIEWSAVSAEHRVTDGVDTFVFDGDGIRVQTMHYTLESVRHG